MQYVPDLLRPRLCSPLTSTLRTTLSHSSMSSQVPACAILSLFLPIATSTVDRIHLSPGDVTGARGRSMHWHTASQHADRRTDGRHKQLSHSSVPLHSDAFYHSVPSKAEQKITLAADDPRLSRTKSAPNVVRDCPPWRYRTSRTCQLN